MLSAEDKIKQMQAVLSDSTAVDDAGIFMSSTNIQQEVRYQTFTLDQTQLLTQPKDIGFPFKSFAVIDATDANVSVKLQLATQDSFQDPFPIKKGSQMQLPFPVRRAFLSWDSQPGKSISILFLLRGKFDANILNLVNSGGVAISEGISPTTLPVVTVQNTATKIVDVDTTRLVATLENQGGAPIYLGDANVTAPGGAKPGITLNPGATYDWKNTGALYGISGGANQSIAVLKLS